MQQLVVAGWHKIGSPIRSHLTLVAQTLEPNEGEPDVLAQSRFLLGADPELFFPVGKTGPALDQIDKAKVVCRRCEVVETCLAWAIEFRQDDGVWGGLSAEERRALKRRTARARLNS